MWRVVLSIGKRIEVKLKLYLLEPREICLTIRALKSIALFMYMLD